MRVYIGDRALGTDVADGVLWFWIGSHIGPNHIYRMASGGPGRFGFRGFYFGFAPYDPAYMNRWLWDFENVILLRRPRRSR